jgi:putative FmdB family regulatory protein
MPIYEFYCTDCHRIFSFLSRSVNTQKRPACPRCARPELERRVSAFAISKGTKEPASGAGPEGMPEMDEAKLASAMESLEGEAEGLNEDDPRQSARMMRKLFGATGMPMDAGMEEALRRMEAGEDPDKIEEEMGDVFAEGAMGGGEPRRGAAAPRRSRPSVDPELHEM